MNYMPVVVIGTVTAGLDRNIARHPDPGAPRLPHLALHDRIDRTTLDLTLDVPR